MSDTYCIMLPLVLLLLVIFKTTESQSAEINVGLTPTMEEDDLVFDLVSHLLDHHFPECHLSMDTDSTDIGPSLQKVFPHQQNRYRPVLVGRMDLTFKVSHQDYRTIWKEEQLYSFRTMPVELKSDVWNGGKCTFTFLLTTSPHQHSLRNLTLHAVSTFRFRNLHDPILIHTTNPRHDNPNRILLTDPLNGVTYKLLSQYSAKSHQLKLHNICYHCHSPTHIVNRPIIYPNKFDIPDRHLLFPKPSTNFNGRKYRLAHFEPYDMNDARIRAKKSFTLLTFEEFILTDIENRFNITTAVYVPEFSLDDYYPNGSYTGFTSAVVYGQADGSLIVYHTSVAQRAVCVAYPFIHFDFSFVTRHPRPVIKWYIVVQPYKPVTWLVICVIIFSSAFVISVSVMVEVKSLKCSLSSYIRNVKHLLRELLEQPVPPAPYTSVRIFYPYILLLSTVVICLYKAKIVSLLASPSLEVLPCNFMEVHDSDMVVGIPLQVRVFIGAGIEKSGIKYLKDMWDRSVPFTNYAECFEKAMHEGYACIVPSYIYTREKNQYVDHEGRPLARWIPDGQFFSYTSPSLPKNDVGFTTMEYLTARYLESGVTNQAMKLLSHVKFLRNYYRARKQLLESKDGIIASESLLTLNKLWPVFGMWVVGVGLSLLSILYELLRKGRTRVLS